MTASHKSLTLLDRQVTTGYVSDLERSLEMSTAIQEAVASGSDVGHILTQHLTRFAQHKANSLQAIIETTLMVLGTLRNLDDTNQKIVNTVTDNLRISVGASKLGV